MCGIMAGKPAKSEADYQAEDDARTMERAHEVMSDSKRLKGVHSHLAKKASTIKSLRSKMMGKPMMGKS